ncbi:MAG: hypothetical protein CSA84_00440 [Actinomycetales bacterium]|nr:MAG: hypothetical protein CSA84_00440 [Actinomycetales bacterium]
MKRPLITVLPHGSRTTTMTAVTARNPTATVFGNGSGDGPQADSCLGLPPGHPGEESDGTAW